MVCVSWQPLTISEYEKLDLNTLPLSEQRRYFKLLNRQVSHRASLGK
jgi:hypothetical protein